MLYEYLPTYLPIYAIKEQKRTEENRREEKRSSIKHCVLSSGVNTIISQSVFTGKGNELN